MLTTKIKARFAIRIRKGMYRRTNNGRKILSRAGNFFVGFLLRTKIQDGVGYRVRSDFMTLSGKIAHHLGSEKCSI